MRILRPLHSRRRLFLVGVLGLAGCDPCFGVGECGTIPPRAIVDGRILTSGSGLAVGGARLDLIVTTATSSDSTSTIADAEGLFHLELPIVGPAPVRIALRNRSVENPGYRIDSIPCVPVVRRGDACELGPIIDAPNFPTLLLRYRNDTARVVGGVHARFTRTGGTGFFGWEAREVFDQFSDPGYGVTKFFGDGVFALGGDAVIGDLLIDFPAPLGTMVRSGYRLVPNYHFVKPTIIQLVGPGLGYSVVFVDSATQLRRRGVSVKFARSGGIALFSDEVTAVSDSNGVAALPLRPKTNGTVTGTLSLRAATGPVITVAGVSLATFDADSSVVLSRWLVGATGTLYQLPP